MKPTAEINLHHQTLQLRGDGTVLLPRTKTLLVADLHLGKDASFRFAGVPVPAGINAKTLDLLEQSIEQSQSTSVIILGDLIHDGNSMTPELEKQFSDWRNSNRDIPFSLVRGNHDRYVDQFPADWRLAVHASIELDGFELVHQTTIEASNPSERFQIGGHWHPVVTVGRGADEMRLPCFMVTDCSLTLPAFGPFKGGMRQSRSRNRSFYPICDGKVWLDQSTTKRNRVSI